MVMNCAWGPVKWWLVKVGKVGQDGVLCQIVIEKPSWDDAEKMIVEMRKAVGCFLFGEKNNFR